MNRRSRLCGAVAGLYLCSAAAAVALAQETDTDMYDGQWSVRMQGSPFGYQSARLVIADYGGTWRDTSSRAARVNKACRATSFPVTVQRSTPTTFEFSVWGTSVSPACPDFAVAIKPTEAANTLQGTMDPAGTVTLVRQAASRKR